MSGNGNGTASNGNGNAAHANGNGYKVPTGRAEWIVKRKAEAERTGDWNMSQMHFARKGLITEEMAFVAQREKIAADLVRSEVAKGTMIIPANINHPELEPMAIGVESLCKINANIGNSAIVSNVDEELRKLHTAVHFGADTVMDLSTGGDIPMIREAILRHSPVPIGTVPLYEALSRVKKVEDLNIDLYLEVIEEQAQQGVDYFTIHAGVLIQYVPLVAKRITGIVSRGGMFGRTCRLSTLHRELTQVPPRRREFAGCVLSTPMAEDCIASTLGSATCRVNQSEIRPTAVMVRLTFREETTRIADGCFFRGRPNTLVGPSPSDGGCSLDAIGNMILKDGESRQRRLPQWFTIWFLHWFSSL